MGLLVMPDPANLDLNAGGPAVTQTFTAIAHLPGGDMDVSNLAAWSIDDTGMGSMPNATFTSVTNRGGTTLVHAVFHPAGSTATLSGEAVLNVRFHGNVTGNCPGCPPFPPDNTPSCTQAGANPTLVYPPDGVLLPPNMNVIEVHFLPGMGNDIYEIDFQNSATDVRVETVCNAVMNARGQPTGGCAYQLDQTVWDYIAQTNRGGDPVKVTVRGAPMNGSCVDHSDSRNISFATEDIHGGIYYWQSVTFGGVAGRTGGIFRHDFGDRNPMSTPFLTPGTQNKCIGCHFLSRDGARMSFGNDDADSDDEYGDIRVNIMDVSNNMILGAQLPAGLQAFSPDHSKMLSSDGVGANDPPVFFRYDGNGAGNARVTFAGLGGKRVTEPDWTKDGMTVYFTVPGAMLTWDNNGPTTGGTGHKDDTHFSGGSIYKMPYDSATDMFGMESPVVMSASADENNYYPSVSPDGNFLVFNRAVGTDLKGHDVFNNPGARLWALKVNGGVPVDMMRANQADGLTNSWPRWSPFIQMYKGKRLLWITFSSTRDYGLRVQNENVPAGQGGPLVNCYPPDTPENPCASYPGSFCHGVPFNANCNQPQIWMAAVSLSDLELSSGDPSFVAFWLPFQDVSAHNHIAQWTEQIVGPPPGDGGACGVQGSSCSASMPCCAGYVCDTTMHCVFNIP
jgi:hypothetical protein